MLSCGEMHKVRRGNLERNLHLAPQTRTDAVEDILWGPIVEDPTKFSLRQFSGLRSRRKSSFQVTPRSKLPHLTLHTHILSPIHHSLWHMHAYLSSSLHSDRVSVMIGLGLGM